jgi:hypothetical protein
VAEARAKQFRLCVSRDYVLWFDNFNRSRYTTQPLRRNVSFNCTSIAWLPLPFLPHPPPQLPAVDILLPQVLVLIDTLPGYWMEFVQTVRATDTLNFSRANVRVPLDFCRSNVTSPPWVPMEIMEVDPAANTGLVHILHNCQALQVLTPKTHEPGIECNLFESIGFITVPSH